MGAMATRQRQSRIALLIMGGLLVVGARASYDPSDELAALTAMISENGYGWIAGETEMNRIAPEERPVYAPLIPPPGASGRLPADALVPRPASRDLPAVWDWRIEGGTTPVRNQGYFCASCWAFGAVAVFESAIMVASGRAEDLSEQQVIDCNTGGWGCAGGPRSAAYEIFMTYGAVSEECLPYIDAENPSCEQGGCEPIDFMDGWEDVPSDITSLKEAVYEQPVAVGMTVYEDLFSYAGGCYENDEQQNANHAVLIVGWDDTMCDGAGAWIVKNSWGTNWGDEGYLYIKYGSASIGTMAQRVFHTPREPLVIRHTPQPDLPSQGEPIAITCEIRAWDHPIADDDVIVHYDAGAGWDTVQMTRDPGTRTGERVTFTGLLPPQSNWTLITYWLSAADTGGNQCVEPPGAPDSTCAFRVLPIIYHDDAEIEGGWTFGAPDDDATTGFWERGIPEGTYSPMGRQGNPDADHTPDPGVNCFCTGLAAGANFWDCDVDGGKTTLITPTLNLSWATAIDLMYYRWYTNNCGQYGDEDYWQVDVSGDGGDTWANLEYTCTSEAAWVEQSFSLHEYVDLGDQVLIRFIAADYINPSIVEAGIDDAYLFIPEAGAQECEHPRGPKLSLRPSTSPFQGSVTLAFDLPRSTHGRLQIFGMDGRSVRTALSGDLPAGRHVIRWDGRNHQHRPAPAGLYIVRLETEWGSVRQRMVKMR